MAFLTDHPSHSRTFVLHSINNNKNSNHNKIPRDSVNYVWVMCTLNSSSV